MQKTTDSGALGFVVTKMYELIISGGMDLNSGVITPTIVNSIIGDLPSDVSENAIQFIWDRRNAVVRASGNSASFPIAKLLAAIPLTYLNANNNVIDTLLQLVDEAGNPIFLGLNDFYSQVVALNGTLATGIANLADIDLLQSSGQLITFGVNAVGVNVLASDAATLVKQWQSIKLRLVVANKTFVGKAAALQNDNIQVQTNALTYLNTALLPITSAGGTADATNLGSGLTIPATADKLQSAAAGFTNTTQYTLTITGTGTTIQLAGGSPAKYLVTSTGTATATASAAISVGSGFISDPAQIVPANYKLVYSIPTDDDYTASGVTKATVATAAQITTANAKTHLTQLMVAGTAATLGLPTIKDTSACLLAIKHLYSSTNVSSNVLASAGFLTSPAAPEFTSTNNLVIAAPEDYINSSVENAFDQLRALWKNVSPQEMVSSGLVSSALSSAAYYPGFVANTYAYKAYINTKLLSYFPGVTVSTLYNFYKKKSVSDTISPTDFSATNFLQPHYDTLTKTQYAATSEYFGLFDMLSTLGFKAEDVFPILVNLFTFTPQIAQDFDYWFNDEPKSSSTKYVPSAGKGYILNQPLIQRLAGFKKGPQVTPTNAFLKGTDKASDIYDAIFNNSKTATSLFAKIEPLKITTTNLQATQPSTSVLYAAAVAQFVQKKLGAAFTLSSVTTGGAFATVAVEHTFTVNNGGGATISVKTAGTTTAYPIMTVTNSGTGISMFDKSTSPPTITEGTATDVTYTPVFTSAFNKANTLGIPDLSYEALFEQCNNPQTADMSQVMAAIYALSNTTSGATAGAGPNVLVSWLASGNDLNTVPSNTSTWFSSKYLAELYQAVADYNKVDVEEIIIASANLTTALTQTEVSKLFVRLVEAPVIKSLKGVNIANLLTLRKGPWSFSKSPVNTLVDIIREFYEGTTAVPITKSIHFYVGALLDYALVNFSDVSAAIDALAAKATFLKYLVFVARNDVDRSNILLLMGTTPKDQLTVLETILGEVPATRLNNFVYYVKSFQMVDLIGNLTVPAATTSSINDGTIKCNAAWVCIFNDLAGVKLLAPYVVPEILLSFTRKLTIYNSQGISNSATTSSRLVFDTNHIVSVYQVSNSILSNLLVEMGIIVQL